MLDVFKYLNVPTCAISLNKKNISVPENFFKVSFTVTSTTGVSTIRFRGQNQPGKDSNLAHWKALENVRTA